MHQYLSYHSCLVTLCQCLSTMHQKDLKQVTNNWTFVIMHRIHYKIIRFFKYCFFIYVKHVFWKFVHIIYKHKNLHIEAKVSSQILSSANIINLPSSQKVHLHDGWYSVAAFLSGQPSSHQSTGVLPLFSKHPLDVCAPWKKTQEIIRKLLLTFMKFIYTFCD